MPLHVEIADANGKMLTVHDDEVNDVWAACVAVQEALRVMMTRDLLKGTPRNPPQPLRVRWGAH
jgi:hypothetical protein